MKFGRIHWVVIVLATAVLIVMAPSDNDGDVAIVARPVDQRSVNSTSLSSNVDKRHSLQVGRVELERLAKLDSGQQQKGRMGDAFNATSWYVPPPQPRYVPPPPVAPPPVIVPTAPPLPFTYLGRYGDTGSRTIILSKGERVYTVAVGDVIENTYRVEKLTSGMVNLTYLPLNIQQSLRTGEAL